MGFGSQHPAAKEHADEAGHVRHVPGYPWDQTSPALSSLSRQSIGFPQNQESDKPIQKGGPQSGTISVYGQT